MNITLTDTNGTYSISTVEDFVSLEEIIALLVKPILLAASFSEAQLDQYFVKEDEFQIAFECRDDDEEVAANAAPEAAPKVAAKQPPMEKVVCKKVVAKAPVTVAPKVVAKVPVEKKVVAAAPKAVAKVATARMAG